MIAPFEEYGVFVIVCVLVCVCVCRDGCTGVDGIDPDGEWSDDGEEAREG